MNGTDCVPESRLPVGRPLVLKERGMMWFSPVLSVHITAGMMGMVSGAAAVIFRKGSPRHALAGKVFCNVDADDGGDGYVPGDSETPGQ